MEGDFNKMRCRAVSDRISTHALTWRATSAGLIHSAVLLFLPTPSHGGRLAALGVIRHNGNFYPRPHMEGDRGQLVSSYYHYIISTHALTWRATSKVAISPQQVLEISTHALTWRATHAVGHEVDKRLISTHALTWRATYFFSIISNC